MKKTALKTATVLALTMMLSTFSHGQKPVKIGVITTLSTKAGYLGEDIRDGFKLAIAQEDGKLGGIPVERQHSMQVKAMILHGSSKRQKGWHHWSERQFGEDWLFLKEKGLPYWWWTKISTPCLISPTIITL